MKKFLAGLGILSLVLLAAAPVLAATTGDVSATVTAQLVAVSVADGSVAYGTLDLNTNEDTTNSGVDDSQTATNDSNITANLAVRSSDAVSGGTNWELAGSASTDAFTHEFCTTTCDSTPVWTDFNADNTTYSTLQNGVAAAGTQTFDLQIGTPTASTDSVEHTTTVTVQVSAP